MTSTFSPSRHSPTKFSTGHYSNLFLSFLPSVVINEYILKGEEQCLIQSFITPELINEYVDGEDTLLMKAVMECNPAMVRTILEKGANPNVPSINTKTPLHMAVELVRYFFVDSLFKEIYIWTWLNLEMYFNLCCLKKVCIRAYPNELFRYWPTTFYLR